MANNDNNEDKVLKNIEFEIRMTRRFACAMFFVALMGVLTFTLMIVGVVLDPEAILRFERDVMRLLGVAALTTFAAAGGVLQLLEHREAVAARSDYLIASARSSVRQED